MLDAIHDLADFERRGDAARGRFVVDHAHGLDVVRLVGGESGLDLFKIGAMAPVARNEIDIELELVGNAAPEHGKLAGLAHQHLVAGLQRVDDRGFPGAGAGRRKDDHGLLGAEHPLQARQYGKADLGKLRTAVIEAGHVHGPQHPVGDIGRSWNLEKMPSSMHGHWGPSRSWLLPPDAALGGAVRIALFGGLVPRSASGVNALDAGLEPEKPALPRAELTIPSPT